MRIFVTGGSGFIGGHVIEALAKEHEVLAMARSEKSAEVVRGFGARAVITDLARVTSKELSGVDVVVHAAAFVEEWGTRAEFEEGNVHGTTRMLAAARDAGVSRFVHIGTEAVLFAGDDLVDADETAPYPAAQRFLYSETKAEAERRVLAANAPGFTTISLRPRLVWGPRDASVLPAVLAMHAKGAYAWLDGGRHLTSTTHVANLVHAVRLALTRGEGGEAYFIADEGTRTIRDFLSALTETQGVTLPGKSIPGAIARPIARLVESVYRLFRVRAQPPMTSFAVSMMSRTVTVRTDKAARVLGYVPVVTVDDGLRAMRVRA